MSNPDSDPSTTVVEEAELIEDGPKHALQNKWKFWYFENNKDKSWEENLRVVSEFYTVEDFWSIYNHIKNASELKTGCSYFVFKDGVKPMWEDPVNRPGGRWLISFDRRLRPQLDNQWLEVLLCLIGEAFDDDGDDICGVVVDIRGKMDKISVWTSDCKNKERILNIGKVIKTRLSLPNNHMTYESHEATSNKTSSSAKSLLTL
uniref:Eukaryotic translation initiation factor 4e n=1 Tax=Isotomurus palustris TaxID=36144 RepID=A0A481SXT1_9HEXA|nr:eukaryotic translation initiation factor 4e [Isotomurus palustris]